MKKRIKIDSAILSAIIILTGFLYLFPKFYPSSKLLDNMLDFLGLIIILKGTLLRMSARGYKKAHSNQGQGLVVSGLYKYSRNPMYLGSFLLGAGFVLIVWPWWSLPFFAYLFYARFIKQIDKEEKHLKNLFGKEYEKYAKKVPRFFPDLKDLLSAKIKELFPLDELLSTKDKYGLIGWPLLAIVLETLQEIIVFKTTNIGETALIFLCAYIVFAAVFFIRYNLEK